VPFDVLTRDEWVERTTRLICIRDLLVRFTEAESLAIALWDRPIDESAATSAAVRTLEQMRHDHEDRRAVFREAA